MVTGAMEERKKLNFHSYVTCNEGIQHTDVVFLISEVRIVAERFEYTIYGYFLGNRIAFSIVQN